MLTRNILLVTTVLSASMVAVAGGYDMPPVAATTPAANNDAGWIVGGQLGWANTHQADVPVLGSVPGSDTGLAARAYVGYDFNRYFGAESGYTFLPAQ